MVAQLKTGVSAPALKRPIAPPVYRPQSVPKVLQRKSLSAPTANINQTSRQPIAPPVYRPAAIRAVLQAKLAGPAQTKKPPVAAPLGRPQPLPKVLQMKNQPAPYQRPHGPQVGRSSGVIQRQYAKGTYVAVSREGRTWHGVVTGIVHHLHNTYRIRVGGTNREVEVPAGDVRLHSAISASPTAAVAAAARMIAASKEERRDGESVNTAGGTWTAVEYNSKMGYLDPSARGLHMKLSFTPNDTVNATNIVLVQTVKTTQNSALYYLNSAAIKARSVDGVSIDQMGTSIRPEYASNPGAGGGGFGSAAVQGGAGEHGYRYQLHGQWVVKAAWLEDNPHFRHIVSASGQVFETTAIAAAGVDTGRYYGSVRWGWSWQPGGAVRLIPLAVVTAGYGASAEFRRSADRWNRTRIGEGVDARDPVQIPLH